MRVKPQVFFLPCCISLALAFSGCGEIKKPDVPVKVEQSPERFPASRRFEILPHDADVAFDTQTGQLCRTWDWQVMGKPSKPDAAGNSPQRKLGELTPTCLSLYSTYLPTGEKPPSSFQKF
jgi:hypothetical protein